MSVLLYHFLDSSYICLNYFHKENSKYKTENQLFLFLGPQEVIKNVWERGQSEDLDIDEKTKLVLRHIGHNYKW